MAREDIRAFAQQLQIPYLIHFTRIGNLEPIVRYGLYPVARLADIGVLAEINDQLRLDGRRDGTSLSIAHPNDKMFYRYRQVNPQAEWVVLGIMPQVLWEKDCAFCRHNAADVRISCQDVDDLRALASFRGMFDQIDGITAREQQRLRAYDPTDVQAEVLVFDVIEPAMIFAVQFQTEAQRAHYAGILGERKTLVDARNGYFSTRRFNR